MNTKRCLPLFMLIFIAVTSCTKTLSREEFRTAIMGKIDADVIKLVGRPDDTRETYSTRDTYSSKMWIYFKKTNDPVTKKTDGTTVVSFDAKGNTVTGIDYRAN